MANLERSLLVPPRSDDGEPTSVVELLSAAIGALRRRYWIVLVAIFACLTLAIAAIVTETPVYKTVATIYIDPRDSRGFQEAGGIILNSDALIVDSEVEILLSSALAERVVKRLGLAEASEPEPEEPSLTARLRALFLPDTPSEDQSGLLSPGEAATRRAVASLLGNLEVARRGDTYVIEIGVSNTDKLLAAKIANAYTAEYLASSLEEQGARFTQLNTWSSTALREALISLQQAEAKVNQFKLDNQIDAGGSQVAGSELAQSNAALVTLRDGRFQNELLLGRIRDFLAAGGVDADMPVVDDAGIRDIRTKILDAELDYARQTATGNRNAPQAMLKARDIEAMRSQLIEQYQTIAAQLDKEIRTSIDEERQLTDRAEALRGQVADVSAKEAELRELQMRADGERAVYQSLLTRVNETSDVLAYKSNSARVLTPAQVPAGPSTPQTGKILALGLLGGTFIGLVLVFIREQLDTGVRQPRELEAIGLRYLGAMPSVPGVWFRWAGRNRMRGASAPAVAGGRRRREIARMSAAINFPFSELSETVRSVVFDAASHKRAAGAAQIVAVTSALPGEGKTMLAANLAAYFAKQGKRVHLVDFNLKNPALSRLFASRRSHQELVDHTATGATGKDAPGATKAADFEFSGQTTQTRSSDFIELVNPEAIANYLDSLKADYDIVVLDVGALSESSDARMCAELADYVVLAVKWNLISAEQLERVLARGLTRQGKTVAAVLTMVPRSERLERSATAEPSARRLQVA